MRLLHFGAFEERYEAVARHVPSGARVVDLCCGDAVLARYLKHAGSYIGLDANERFIRYARRQRTDARLWDAATMSIPECDVAVIQSSLYQFHPNEEELVRRMLDAARLRVIVAEPVSNWTTDGASWQKFLARRMTRVSGRNFEFRHDATSLDAVAKAFSDRRIVKERAGRDLVITIDT